MTDGNTYNENSVNFDFYWDYDDGVPENEQQYTILTSSPSSFTLTIDKWDTTTGTATGTFSGTLNDPLIITNTILVENGKFSACIE